MFDRILKIIKKYNIDHSTAENITQDILLYIQAHKCAQFRCADCACLVEDDDGDWYCDDADTKCINIYECPNESEEE